MICIADSRFQEGLRAQAVAHNKLNAKWQIPEAFKHNTPNKIKNQLIKAQEQGYFPAYPFGEDFTDKEKIVIGALKWLKVNTRNKYAMLKTISKSLFSTASATDQPYLEMMELDQTTGFREKLSAKLLICALKHTHG